MISICTSVLHDGLPLDIKDQSPITIEYRAIGELGRSVDSVLSKSRIDPENLQKNCRKNRCTMHPRLSAYT